MMLSRNVRRGGWLALVATVLFTGQWVHAQQDAGTPPTAESAPLVEPQLASPTSPPANPVDELPAPTPPAAADENPAPSAAPPAQSYWLGLKVTDLAPPVRAERKLPADLAAVLVDDVLPDGPASRAGIQPGDILLQVDGNAVGDAQQLASLVGASGGKELKLSVLRGAWAEGQSPLEIAVTPEVRPGRLRDRLGAGRRRDGGWGDRVRDMFQRFAGELPEDFPMPEGFQVWRLGPGAMIAEPFPADLHVIIDKQGDQPAKVIVERNSQKWELREDNLEALPPDVRPHVERLLGHGRMPGVALPGGFSPHAPGRPHPGDPPGAGGAVGITVPPPAQVAEAIRHETHRALEAVQHTRQALEGRIDQLAERIEHLRERQAPELERRLQEQLEGLRHELGQQQRSLGESLDRHLNQKLQEMERAFADRMQQLDEMLAKQRELLEKALQNAPGADAKTL